MGETAISVSGGNRAAPLSAGRQGSPRFLLISFLSFLISFAVLTFFWWKHIHAQFSPLGDQFSLFVNSTHMFHPQPSAWFLEGFSRYFHPYPQWPNTGTDFLRPVANAVYFLASLLFGHHWSWYLLSNYLFQSAIVGLAVFIAGRHLKFSRSAALGIGLLCFLSPAFGNSELFSTAFAFDLLAAALVLAGINELLFHRRLAAGILFTVAIFTKETAFFAPFAATVVAFRQDASPGARRSLHSLYFLSPYVVWVVIRLAAFHATVGAYPVPRHWSGTPLALLEDLGRWPFPLGADVNRHSGALPGNLFYLTTAISVCFWLVLLTCLFFLVYRRLRKNHIGGESQSAGWGSIAGQSAAPAEIVLIFCVLSSAILILIPHLSARFGATFLPLLFLSLAVSAKSAKRRSIRFAAWCFLVLPIAVSLSARGMMLPGALKSTQLRWALAADYVHKISASRAPAIFTVDDLSGGFSSNGSIAKFAGYKGRLVRVNDVVWRPGCTFVPEVAVTQTAGSGTAVTSRIDDACASYGFLGASPQPTKAGALTRDIANGETRVTYQMPRPATKSESIEMSVLITGAPLGAVILVPDRSSAKYRAIPIAAAQRVQAERAP